MGCGGSKAPPAGVESPTDDVDVSRDEPSEPSREEQPEAPPTETAVSQTVDIVPDEGDEDGEDDEDGENAPNIGELRRRYSTKVGVVKDVRKKEATAAELREQAAKLQEMRQ